MLIEKKCLFLPMFFVVNPFADEAVVNTGNK